VVCGLCGEWVYIWNYYTLEVIDDITFTNDIWWVDPTTMKKYGRPKSYCRKCNLVAQKGKEAIDIWRTVCTNRRLNRIDDPARAERKAYTEQAQRDFRESHPELFETMGPPIEGVSVELSTS